MNHARCFVIQPFGKKKIGANTQDNDKVYEALKKLEKLSPEFPIEIFRGDTEKVARENLNSHVSGCINKSDFCIADFTGQNPNVLYETGYARGKEKKVLIITQNLDDIPSDIKGVIAISYNMSNLNVLANDVHHHLDRVKDSPDKRLHNELEQVPYISRRDDDLIKSKIRGAKTRIDILGIYAQTGGIYPTAINQRSGLLRWRLGARNHKTLVLLGTSARGNHRKMVSPPVRRGLGCSNPPLDKFRRFGRRSPGTRRAPPSSLPRAGNSTGRRHTSECRS